MAWSQREHEKWAVLDMEGPEMPTATCRRGYATDLTDDQWELLEVCIPESKPGGRPRTTAVREVLNAIFYLERSGCAWRLLPHDFPKWETVYTYFRNWKLDGTWDRIHDTLRDATRQLDGRNEEPSAGIIDSQSVKTTEKREPGVTMRAKRSRAGSATSS